MVKIQKEGDEFNLDVSKGSIFFNKEEVRFSVDNKGNPTGFKIKKQKEANFLIEEFMLLANKAVATKIKEATKTGVYRVHDLPDEKKLTYSGSRLMQKCIRCVCQCIVGRILSTQIILPWHQKAGEFHEFSTFLENVPGSFWNPLRSHKSV